MTHLHLCIGKGKFLFKENQYYRFKLLARSVCRGPFVPPREDPAWSQDAIMRPHAKQVLEAPGANVTFPNPSTGKMPFQQGKNQEDFLQASSADN